MGKLVANRYSEALFDVAIELNKVDEFHKEINILYSIFKEEKDLMILLTHPRISKDKKKELLDTLFKEKISIELVNFLYILIDKGREKEVLEIIDAFNELYNDYKGILKVTAISAVELKEKEEQRLISELNKLLNKDIVLSKEVDPSIMGGLVIKTKDKLIDASIKGKLNRLNDRLSNIVV